MPEPCNFSDSLRDDFRDFRSDLKTELKEIWGTMEKLERQSHAPQSSSGRGGGGGGGLLQFIGSLLLAVILVGAGFAGWLWIKQIEAKISSIVDQVNAQPAKMDASITSAVDAVRNETNTAISNAAETTNQQMDQIRLAFDSDVADLRLADNSNAEKVANLEDQIRTGNQQVADALKETERHLSQAMVELGGRVDDLANRPTQITMETPEQPARREVARPISPPTVTRFSVPETTTVYLPPSAPPQQISVPNPVVMTPPWVLQPLPRNLPPTVRTSVLPLRMRPHPRNMPK